LKYCLIYLKVSGPPSTPFIIALHFLLDNEVLQEIAATTFFPVKIHLVVSNLSDIFALTWIPSIV